MVFSIATYTMYGSDKCMLPLMSEDESVDATCINFSKDM